MDLGGGRERLPEESRWAGSGWQSGLLGARAASFGRLGRAGMTRSAGRGRPESDCCE